MDTKELSMSDRKETSYTKSDFHPSEEALNEIDREVYYDCLALYNRNLYRLCAKFLRRHTFTSEEYYLKSGELIRDSEFEIEFQSRRLWKHKIQ